MYLYLTFFNESNLLKKNFYLANQFMNNFKLAFPNYMEFNWNEIDGSIGFLKGIDNADKKCFTINIEKVQVNNDFISFQYDIGMELNITNGFIDKSLYKLARQSGWIKNENRYYPILCIVEKDDFDAIRKGIPNIRKLSSNSAKIDEYRSNGNWNEICNMYEPLEEISGKCDIWNNVDGLYNIAFACSKLGESQNGMERDKKHLAKIKRYRDLSITFFKRCCEIEPNNFRYPSSVAYRYYQNVIELTKPKGRRDGSVADEISNAIVWFDKALKIYPNSIKDNYRKGKLILDKKAAIFKLSQKEWTKDTYTKLEKMEQTAVTCLQNAIEKYEQLTDENTKKYYHNEYVKSLYCLGCYYLEKPKNLWTEYTYYNMLGIRYNYNMTNEDADYILKAKELFEKCFNAETDISLNNDLDCKLLSQFDKKWAESPMDKLYRLGWVYLDMFFIEKQRGAGTVAATCGQKAEKYLTISKAIGDELRKNHISGRNTWFISEKLAWYYILSGDYGKAINLLEHSHDSYIKNTYATALLLSDFPDRFEKAEAALKIAISDRNNKAVGTSITLLAFSYKINNDSNELKALLSNNDKRLNASNKKFVSLLESEGHNHENR